MSHTPGPWIRYDYRVFRDEGEYHIGREVAWTANNARTRTPESLDNARLIASAPDLLAIVQGLLNPRVGMPSLIAAAKTVMQKVEGQ